MNYSLLTVQDVEKRFSASPDSIKTILESDTPMEVVRQICAGHHLVDEEKVLMVQQLTSLVLLGFISSHDFDKEMSVELNLDHRHADDIAADIDKKIFRDIAQDINKVYSPLADLRQPEPVVSENILDLRPKKEEPKAIVPPKVEAPKILSFEPKQDLIEIKPKEPAPGEPSLSRASSAPPAPSTSASESGPVIIHKELELTPTSGQKDKWSLGGFFGGTHEKAGTAPSAPSKGPILASVDMGGDVPSSPEARKSIFTPKAPQRIVHYTDFRTPLVPFQAADQIAGREVKIDIAANKPTTPLPTPTPPAAPKPLTSTPSVPPKPLTPSSSPQFSRLSLDGSMNKELGIKREAEDVKKATPEIPIPKVPPASPVSTTPTPPSPPIPNISIHLDSTPPSHAPKIVDFNESQEIPAVSPAYGSGMKPPSFVSTAPQKQAAAPANLPIGGAHEEEKQEPPVPTPPAPVIEIVLRDERGKGDARGVSIPEVPKVPPKPPVPPEKKYDREAMDKLEEKLRRDMEKRGPNLNDTRPQESPKTFTPRSTAPSTPSDPRVIDLRTFKVIKKDTQ